MVLCVSLLCKLVCLNMNEPLKYLIVDNRGVELPIVFNSILSHADVAGTLRVVSAGFCRLHNDLNKTCSTWGESFTLKVKSRDIDSEILTRNFNQND